MSGSFSQISQQQVTTNYAAWAPSAFLTQGVPTGSQFPPNAFQFGLPPTPPFSTIRVSVMETIWNAWDRRPPLPENPTSSPKNLIQSAGATFTVFRSSPLIIQSTILPSWISPDPLPTLPAFQFGKHFTPSGPPPLPPPVPGNAVTPPHGVALNGAVPVYITTNSAYNGAVPRAGTNSVITVGGQAIVAVTGPINGGYIYNPPNAASQGVTIENINVDMTAPPGAGDAYGYGTTSVIAAGQTFTLPVLATGVQVWANAVTSGHRITVVVW